jgi:CheY-like chemotaxis protein
MTRIAAVGADMAMLELYEQLCAEAGYEAILCPDAATAYERIGEAAPDAIILNLRLSLHNAGWAVLRDLEADARLRETPVLVCTADTRVVGQCAGDLQRLGCALLVRPFDIDTLLDLLCQAVSAQPCARPAVNAPRRFAQLQMQSEQKGRAVFRSADEAMDEVRAIEADIETVQTATWRLAALLDQIVTGIGDVAASLSAVRDSAAQRGLTPHQARRLYAVTNALVDDQRAALHRALRLHRDTADRAARAAARVGAAQARLAQLQDRSSGQERRRVARVVAVNQRRG